MKHTSTSPPSHGVYTHGCRCDDCREAHRSYTRERRAKSLADGTLSHGTRSTYDAGCRCERCVWARSVVYWTQERDSAAQIRGPRS